MIPVPKPKPLPKSEPWNFVEVISLAAFLIWSAAGLFFTIKHVSPEIVAGWSIPDGLRKFIELCRQNGDPILILLAFINTHLHAARQWSSGIARRWGLILLVFAFAIETYGAHTGFPFGDYHYTDRFGPVLGLVPLTIPLAWHIVVTNTLFAVRMIAPHASRLVEAVLTAVFCTVYDFILEPFATTVKGYWIWTDGSIPPLNYATWFVLSGVFVRIFAPTFSTRYRSDPRPVLILSLTLAIFVAGEL